MTDSARMDRLIAQLKRIADALEQRDREVTFTTEKVRRLMEPFAEGDHLLEDADHVGEDTV